jgi:hypothetical protein
MPFHRKRRRCNGRRRNGRWRTAPSGSSCAGEVKEIRPQRDEVHRLRPDPRGWCRAGRAFLRASGQGRIDWATQTMLLFGAIPSKPRFTPFCRRHECICPCLNCMFARIAGL